MKAYEVNFDGLVGLTHNYSGLSYGNIASMAGAHQASNPKEAAKQGLRKMKSLHDLGLKQGVLLPQERPDVRTLRQLGFGGSDAEVVRRASREAPEVFEACCSASSMWAANAATVSPSADTADGKVHFTPANLASNVHRAIETETTGRILQAIFVDTQYFRHHVPLPRTDPFCDEGAANHTRLCSEYGEPGIELFVYGRYAFGRSRSLPKRFPARQTFEASESIARLHGLPAERVVFARQNPDVIDSGVFHNDVIAVGNQNVFFYHEKAFVNTEQVRVDIQRRFGEKAPHFIEVEDSQISVPDAVESYLFNSQLITLTNGEMMIIIPKECEETESVWQYLQELIQQDMPIKHVMSFNLKQSMRNGGGPACLRLRVVLNEQELAALNSKALMSDWLYEQLNQWVDKHYRDRMHIEDLSDPQLLREGRTALDELTQILELGAIYPFQLV
ncbi:MAG: N-succinylarginine dihydrolase [Deltaproteobacteria bacterium]|nr:N-succinylarginine dihydrolase [Deltaproteobacteria bacterium]MBW1858625.1 N-succinylarginine dihydrolase [Deltaproteobacteria bacterium]